MRVSLALVVVFGLFACSQAVVDLGVLKDVGVNLVNGVVEKLKGAFLDAMKKIPAIGNLLSNFGKRALVSDFLEKLKGVAAKGKALLDAGKLKAGDAFKAALAKLKEIHQKFVAKLGMAKDDDVKDMKKAVDDTVAAHKEEHKRILGDLLQKGKDLVSGVVDSVKGFASGLKETASQLVSSLLQKGTDLLVGKRATLSDHLQTVGNALSSAFSPFKDIVAGLGNTLKGHFSNLVDTVKGHAVALKDKLSGHVDDLKTHGSTLLNHGKNAVGALSEVVGDILKQTLANAGPAIDGLAKTAAGAGQTVLDHLSGGSSA